MATDLPAPDIGMPPEAVPVPAGGMPLEEVLIDTEEIVEWLSYEDTKN